MVFTRSRVGLPGKVAVMLCATLAIAACGKKAPPFLPVPLEAKELILRNAAVQGGKVSVAFRVPSEVFSFAGEEERWGRAELYRRTAGKGNYEVVAELAPDGGFAFGQLESLIDGGPFLEGSYEYRVELKKNESEEWAEAGPVTVAVIEPPEMTETPKIAPREGGLAVTWQPPPDAPEGTAYLLYRREGKSGTWQAVSPEPFSTASYVDTRILQGRTYCYRVVVVVAGEDSTAEGVPSAEVCGSSVDRTPPPPPEKLIAVIVEGGIRLSWLAPTADDVKGFNVYRSVPGETFDLIGDAPAGAARYLDREAVPGQTYRYRVTAVDSSQQRNESPFSNTVTATLNSP